MEVLQMNEKKLHAEEVEMLQTSEKKSVELPSSHVTSPVIMTIYSGSINDVINSVLAANLAAYIGERHFDVLLVDLGTSYTPSQLHGVELSQDEFGVLEAWLAYDTYAAILLASGDAPVVKPSAKAKGVYVMPSGDVDVIELKLRKTKIDDKAIARLRSLIVRQAEKYRTPLVLINPPPSLYISDLILSFSDMAAVAVSSLFDTALRQLEVIMKYVGGYLSNMSAVFIVATNDASMEDGRSVWERISTSFPVYRLPFSIEAGVYAVYGKLIFITVEPKTDSGRRWQAEFARFAEAVVEKAREISRNKAKKQEKSDDL